MRFKVEAELSGKRLDQALKVVLPGHSLRAGRRLIADGNVLVNGACKAAGAKLSPGDVIEILPTLHKADAVLGSLLKISNDFCFFHKPSGLHTAQLAGRSNANLESQLPYILPQRRNLPKLLQRLDYGTSGIICAAFTEQSQQFFRRQEEEGACAKYYLALLSGRLTGKKIVKNVLNTNTGAKVRVLDSEGDKMRWSIFIPICPFPAQSLGINAHAGKVEDATLAICRIWKGQRHQIRAHAAALGFPLVGDPIYGVHNGLGFFLEHFYLNFAEYKIFDLGKQSLYSRLPLFAQNSILQWLKREAGFEPA